MWRTDDYVKTAYTDQLLTDESDTVGGFSGASCHFLPQNVIYAAHSGSVTSGGTTLNRHTRITSSKFTAFCSWINNPSLC